MNILEVSFLVADVIIVFGAVASYSRFRRLKKQVDCLQTKMDSFQDNIYQLQTYQRYDLKFELDEIRNQQEKSQVTISKLGMDLTSVSQREVYPELLKILNLIELLNSKFDGGTKKTKPTDSVKNKLVKIIQEEQPPLDDSNQSNEDNAPCNEDNAPFELPLTRRRVKTDAKRVISTRELEIFFKEVTKLTYRGYVLKHGQGEFQYMKSKVYKKLYFQKFTKPRLAEQKSLKA
jgi:hypothetical protein